MKRPAGHPGTSSITGLVLALALLLTLFLPGPSARAAERVERRDTNQDGLPDEIAHLDQAGNLTRLELDRDGDGKIDQVQAYASGQIVRLERDRNRVGRMDERYEYQNGR
jgi:hypothetical protein